MEEENQRIETTTIKRSHEMQSYIIKLEEEIAKLQKENKKLREDNNKLQNKIGKLQKENSILKEKIELLSKENKELKEGLISIQKEFRKYKNENTPSSVIPSYLKDKFIRIIKEKEKESKENSGKTAKINIRNKRKKNYDRKEIHLIEGNKCPYCSNTLRKRKRKIKKIVIHLNLPTVESVLHEGETYFCDFIGKEV